MRHKRDYQRNNFKNPFFPKNKNQKKKFGFKSVFFLIFIVVILFAIASNVSRLQIKEIKVFGNEYISQVEIKGVIATQLAKKRFFFFSQNNILFFSRRQAAKELQKKYLFEQLKIKKQYFDTIVITLKEKTSGLIWLTGSSQYYLDLTGKVIRKIENDNLVVAAGAGTTQVIRQPASIGNYPLVADESNQPIEPGQQVLNQSLVDFVISLNQKLKDNAGFEVLSYGLVSSSAKEIKMITRQGWEVYFNTTEAAQKQADRLSLVLNEKVKDRSKLKYIDLRYGDKVFLN
ncbi:MAG: FtsQ-type POTRA domain-containing protein [Patescibacteria group bacterium]|jgi:cell division septal protein FtsQ